MSYKTVIAKTGTAAGLVLLATACKGTGLASGPPASSASAATSPSGASVPSTASSPAVTSPEPAASRPAPAPSGSPAPSEDLVPCATKATTETFVQVTAAEGNADGSLALTIHPATLVCGGPDDLHYDVAASTETATVTPSATVQVFVSGSSPAGEMTIPHSELSGYVKQDAWGDIFQVTGSLTAITALEGMFHP